MGADIGDAQAGHSGMVSTSLRGEQRLIWRGKRTVIASTTTPTQNDQSTQSRDGESCESESEFNAPA